MKAGFEGAPISFVLFSLTIIVSFISIFQVFGKNSMILSKDAMFKPWKVLTFLFSTTRITEMIYSLILIYNFRALERRWTSYLFIKYIIVTYIVTLPLSLLTLQIQNVVYSLVPLFTVFVVHYYLEVLPLVRIKMLTVEVSDNILVYCTFLLVCLFIEFLW